jgi:hypothetical protein
MSGAIPPLPRYAFVAWCSVKKHHHNRHLLSQVPFPLVLLLLNQWWTPSLRLQDSDCSISLIIFDAPSTAVFFFCTEPIECFPGTVYRYSFSPMVTTPVGPMITGVTKHWNSTSAEFLYLRLLYFNFFSHSFVMKTHSLSWTKRKQNISQRSTISVRQHLHAL